MIKKENFINCKSNKKSMADHRIIEHPRRFLEELLEVYSTRVSTSSSHSEPIPTYRALRDSEIERLVIEALVGEGKELERKNKTQYDLAQQLVLFLRDSNIYVTSNLETISARFYICGVGALAGGFLGFMFGVFSNPLVLGAAGVGIGAVGGYGLLAAYQHYLSKKQSRIIDIYAGRIERIEGIEPTIGTAYTPRRVTARAHMPPIASAPQVASPPTSTAIVIVRQDGTETTLKKL